MDYITHLHTALNFPAPSPITITDNTIDPVCALPRKEHVRLFPERDSPTNYEPNEQVEELTSLNFASIQGDSGMSSILIFFWFIDRSFRNDDPKY